MSTPIRRSPPTSSTCSVTDSRIARRYGVKSQPAFPLVSGFLDGDDVAGQTVRGHGKDRNRGDHDMSKSNVASRTTWQGLVLAGMIAGSVVTASTALAGECLAGKMQPNARPMVDHKPVGVTDV